MKKTYIGNGVQYFVYDIGNGKVLKKKTSWFKKIKIFRNWWPNMKLTKIIAYTLETTKRTKLGKKFIKENPHLLPTFGNPIYPNKLFRIYDFIQDKVSPLDKHLQTSSFEESKSILEKYITFLIESRKNGFSDMIFNFDRNCGINEIGEIVMIDFGELSFKKHEVQKAIIEKLWLKKESYKDLSPELKIFFEQEMNKRITLDTLELHRK